MAQGSTQTIAMLRRLLALARGFLQTPDLAMVLELAGQAIPELLHSDGSLLLVQTGEHEFVRAFGPAGTVLPRRQEAELVRHARRAMADRTPILLPEISPESGLGAREIPSPGFVSLIAYPFPPVRPVGALVAVWYRKGGRKELARLIPSLRLLGEITGAGLGNVSFRRGLEERIDVKSQEIAEAARAHAVELLRRDSVEEEIQRIALTDMMTGLLNRRGFFVHAERSFKLAHRQRTPSAVIFIDIDGLKAINDAYGHDVGDSLIEDVAYILLQSFRDADVVARIGGDEFAAFTFDSAQPDVLMSRIRANLAAFVPKPDSPYRISFSTGIVQCDPELDLSLSDYLMRADNLMYEQKHKPIVDT